MSTMKDLARVLSLRTQMTQRESENFVSEMFDVVKEALNTEGQVKIKGLGVFKLQKVRERESIDVNTGKRVLIASHDRISFTPDTLMKDAVNKPFSHFETVILNDGVEFEDTPEENEAEIPDATTSDTTTEDIPQPVVEETPAPVVKETTEPEVEETPAPEVEETPEPEVEETPAPVVEETTADVVEETPANEGAEEPVGEDVPPLQEDIVDAQDSNATGISWLKILGMTAACFVIFAAGVFVGRITAPEVAKVIKIEPKDTATVAKDTTANASDAMSHQMNDSTKKQPRDTVKTAVKTTAPKDTVKTVKPAVPNNEKFNYDVRVRTGAWVIVGTRCEHKVKEGQTLQSISRFYLGDGMECYVEVFNNNIKEVKTGDKLKIPELKNKKQLRK